MVQWLRAYLGETVWYPRGLQNPGLCVRCFEERFFCERENGEDVKRIITWVKSCVVNNGIGQCWSVMYKGQRR